MPKRTADPENIPEIRTHISLAPWNTLQVEACADHVVTIRSGEELQVLSDRGVFAGREVWVLGGGSNVLFRGRVRPLVIKNEISGISAEGGGGDDILVTAGAGENWHNLVTWCVNNRYGGIENLAMIPGTVGAAPIQNIGAYGRELSDVFSSLQAFDLDIGTFREFGPEECTFGYRDSWFKQQQDRRLVISSVTLRLQKPPHTVESNYRSLREWLELNEILNPGIREIFRGVMEIRSRKLPDPAVLGNAGSFFKNPIVSEAKLQELMAGYREVPNYPAGEGMVKIPAGWLIEQAGWRGKRVGNVGTYEKQALVIVNHGGASGFEVWTFAMLVRDSVMDQFGIQLTPEVQVVGDSNE